MNIARRRRGGMAGLGAGAGAGATVLLEVSGSVEVFARLTGSLMSLPVSFALSDRSDAGNGEW